MKKIDLGFLGLGLLGLPMALAFASKGLRVRGFDAKPDRMSTDWYPNTEKFENGESLKEISNTARFSFSSYDEVVSKSDIIFIAVQTPSEDGYDGSTPFPSAGVSYNLQNLEYALRDLANVLEGGSFSPIIVIVSTVMPGTIRRLIGKYAFRRQIEFVHNPAFSAVGTMINDFFNPEFVLIGTESEQTAKEMCRLYKAVTKKTVFVTNLENAEMIKTCYNGFISLKICYANTLMELAHKIPNCDIDAIMDCLQLATKRLISPMYLRGGMGDGGGCHPKENAALSYLAKQLDLSYDLFGQNMICRDNQAKWIAQLAFKEHKRTNLPICILGTAFKADVGLEDGSPAILLSQMLEMLGASPELCDPHVPHQNSTIPDQKRLFILATKHQIYKDIRLPRGSIVIDPWRFHCPTEGVSLVSIGV